MRNHPVIAGLLWGIVVVAAPGRVAAQRADRAIRPAIMVAGYVGDGSDYPFLGVELTYPLLRRYHGFTSLNRSTDAQDGGWKLDTGVGLRDLSIFGSSVILQTGLRVSHYEDRALDNTKLQWLTEVGWEMNLKTFRPFVTYQVSWFNDKTGELTLGLNCVLSR
jgi:hypothetical protein